MSLAYSNVRPIRPDKQATDRPEATGKGFALIHRQFMDSRLYKDSQAVHLWIHLILKVNNAPAVIPTDIGDVAIGRGQTLTSRPKLAMETGMSDDKIRALLRTFTAQGMIEAKSIQKKFSLITVLKYDDFQEKICPTNVQALSNANPHPVRAEEALCPTDVQALSINNITSNTNVLDSRQRIFSPAVQQDKTQRPEAAIQSSKGDKWGTADDLKAAEWMFDVVKSIEPSARKPAFAGWANDIRLMREKDGRDHRDMCSLFRWASQDSFWCGNVLCPAKLREKWSQLAIKRDKAKSGTGTGKPVLDFNNTDWAEGLQL